MYQDTIFMGTLDTVCARGGLDFLFEDGEFLYRLVYGVQPRAAHSSFLAGFTDTRGHGAAPPGRFDWFSRGWTVSAHKMERTTIEMEEPFLVSISRLLFLGTSVCLFMERELAALVFGLDLTVAAFRP